MRFSFTLTITPLLLAFSTVSVASSGPYIGFKGGQSQLRDMNYQTGAGRVLAEYSSGRTLSFITGAATPYENGFRVRSELEVGRQSGEVSGNNRSGDTRARFGFFNLYGDSQINQAVDFVFGTGVGVAEVTFDNHSSSVLAPRLDDKDVGFGYQLTAGLSASLSERVTFEGTYRFQSWENINIQTSDGNRDRLRVGSHNLQAGLRVSF